MIYHKYQSTDRTTITNEIHDDELVAYCYDCNEETPVTLEDICKLHEHGFDMVGTRFFCVECQLRSDT